MVQSAAQASEPGKLAPGIPQPGEIFARRYQIERVLGIGGMGAVLAAIQLPLQRRVAIKMLRPEATTNPEAVARFTREAKTAYSIQNKHVVQILDVGALEPDGLPFIVMEYLDGLDLGQLLLQRKRLPIQEAIGYVLQACEAIACAHHHGVVHRDLKPANLFLTHQEGTPTIKVLDFGISKVAQTGENVALTATSFAFGTPLYMSPEQVRSAKYVDPRTDIWALGVILHELLTGRPPFEGETLTALCAAITADPPRPLRKDRPDAPEELQDAILRCLQKDPTMRPASVLEFASRIAPLGPPESPSLLEAIKNIGAAASFELSQPRKSLHDPHGTHDPWESQNLSSPTNRRWVALTLAATLGVGLLAAILVMLFHPISTSSTIVGAVSASTSAPQPASSPASSLPSAEPTISASNPPISSAAPTPTSPSFHPPRTSPKKIRTDVQLERR